MNRNLLRSCTAWSDFWACLAAALDSPRGDIFHDSFVRDLPDDLAEIAAELGMALDAEISSFREAAACITDATDLQRIHATLFLTPPAPVMLNTGCYLDGGLKGPSEATLDALYRRHGLARGSSRRELADTPSAQCALVSLLYAGAADAVRQDDDLQAVAYVMEAQRCLMRFPRNWVTAAVRDLERACEERDVNRVYLHLFRILWLGVDQVASEHDTEVASTADVAEDRLPAGSSRGIGALSAEDLAEIAFCLERDGLAWDHITEHDGWSDKVFARRRSQAAADSRRLTG